MTQPTITTRLLGVALLLFIGFLGALAASAIGAPLPFLLGAMAAAAIVTLTIGPRIPLPMQIPNTVRSAFISIIGVMIGSAFSPDLLSQTGVLIPGSVAILVFVLAAQALNYTIFHRLGGYDRVSATAAAMPGGLMESLEIAEQKGGDVPLVTAQQFLRITLIVTLLPIGFSLWQGGAVGSAAGMSFTTIRGGPLDWLLLAAAAILGFFGGRALKIPAYAIVGPMLLSAFVHGIGWTHAAVPPWLVALAQLVVGVSLGTRFANFRGHDARKVLTLGLLSAVVMTGLGVLIASVLHQITGTPIPVLILSFAPGGLIEMGLIALSLEASPLIVTLYHVIRILLTVLLATLLFSRLRPEDDP